MANGDLAAASLGWVPINPATDDIRLGYDRINELADRLATAAGFGAWTLAPLSAATGFSTITDPAGNTSGTLAGGVRKHGNLLDISFRITYNGATITASNGDIGDTTCANLAAGYRPSSPRFINFGPNGQGLARVGSDGIIQLITLDSAQTIPAGRILQLEGVIPL